jgi:ribosomal protein S1
MNTISVGEMLKIHGRWIEANQFNKLIAKRTKLSERRVFQLIKEAYEHKEILRVEVGKYVLYGLAEFGPTIAEAMPKPSRLNFFSYKKWKTQFNDAKRKRELKRLDAEYRELLRKINSNEDEWKP